MAIIALYKDNNAILSQTNFVLFTFLSAIINVYVVTQLVAENRSSKAFNLGDQKKMNLKLRGIAEHRQFWVTVTIHYVFQGD